MSESPWSSFDIKINFIMFIVQVVYSTVILLLYNWIFLVIYWIFWGLYMTLGRYVTCRHCEYYGKACPSWCMGLIGAKLFKRSEKENFCQDGFAIPFVFDVLFLIIALMIPLIMFLYVFLVQGLNLVDWTLLIINIVISVLMIGTHMQTGCKKCNITDCPMSGKREK